MRLITKEEYVAGREVLIKKIAQGAIFVFPSDTTYRIGCDATNAQAVQRLREVKNSTMPFSIIAPSKQWIRANFSLDEDADDALDLLPGRYVMVLPLENKSAVSEHVRTGELVGVRIPRHWTHEIASLLGRPIVTTSANISGEDYMTTHEDLHPALRKVADFCLYEGEISGSRVHVIDSSRQLEEV